ncbi:hypothetical protein [Natronobacterium texcoconense]|uniref:Uncharacterized protein n=1 Tax=Natronobacterium texcoconense TaxID=1095778 RepID=A0A1H1IKE1_NATTX|nr:hypothetical protein [Natronobacterium texcoconense]SDR38235.1 hypothetical protein SAMN04489842_3579 [Natronobacterium texcoconense]
MAVNVSSVDDADATTPSAVGFFDADGCSDLDTKTGWSGADAGSTTLSEGCVDGSTQLPVDGTQL